MTNNNHFCLFNLETSKQIMIVDDIIASALNALVLTQPHLEVRPYDPTDYIVHLDPAYI
jgi:hypothetical protein